MYNTYIHTYYTEILVRVWRHGSVVTSWGVFFFIVLLVFLFFGFLVFLVFQDPSLFPRAHTGLLKTTITCTSSSKGSNSLVPCQFNVAFFHLPPSYANMHTYTEIKANIYKEDIIWNYGNLWGFSTQSPWIFSHNIPIKCKVLCSLGSYDYLFTGRNAYFPLLYTGGKSEKMIGLSKIFISISIFEKIKDYHLCYILV